MKKGGPYVMFGDGHLAACKPISEEDLAKFMADCVTESDKIDQVGTFPKAQGPAVHSFAIHENIVTRLLPCCSSARISMVNAAANRHKQNTEE